MAENRKKKHRLTDVRCSEVSIVDRAAVGQDGRNFYLFKRDVPGRSGTTDDLTLLQTIQDGIDRLKKSSWKDYQYWRNHPDSFIYTFSKATEQNEFDGDLTIKRKLASMNTLPAGVYPPGETRDYKFYSEEGCWRPKRRLNRD